MRRRNRPQPIATNAYSVVTVRDYHEHALGSGADASAVAFIEIVAPDGESVWGVGVDRSIVVASMRAIVSAANRVARAASARAA